jgi:hypothetical protein
MARFGNDKRYVVFTRTWWRRSPVGRVPGPGKKHTHERGLTYDEALRYCERWNSTHKPGPLSRKCEFTSED